METFTPSKCPCQNQHQETRAKPPLAARSCSLCVQTEKLRLEEQFLDTRCRHCNMKCPKFTLHNQTAKTHLIAPNRGMIWRETLDICCFKCKIMTSSETGGFCKQEAQHSEFILKASGWRCADQRSAGRLHGYESDCATAAENELRTSGCLRV